LRLAARENGTHRQISKTRYALVPRLDELLLYDKVRFFLFTELFLSGPLSQFGQLAESLKKKGMAKDKKILVRAIRPRTWS